MTTASRPSPRSPDARRSTDAFVADIRGQTLQDYITGISIFLIVTAFVVAFLPTLADPFEAPIEADQTAQADRVASRLVDSLTYPVAGNTLNATATDAFFDPATSPTDGDDLRDRLGLDATTNVNVTIQTVETLPDESVGDPYGEHAVAAVTRVVTDDGNRCQPTCRVVVRVW